jgi:hypothetical protein
MNTTLQVTIKSVYGKDTFYPVCDQARRLAHLVGTKTLTQQTIRDAMAMGFHVEYVDAYRMSNRQALDEIYAINNRRT